MKEKPKIISREIIYEGWLIVEKYTLENLSIKFNYDVVSVGDGVAVLPFLDENNLLLCKQYRLPINEMILEMVQGGIAEGESALRASKRELLEETGYIGEMQYLGFFYPLPTALNMRLHLFKATNLKKIREPEINPLEELLLVEIPFEQVLREVVDGKHRDSALREGIMLCRLKK